MTLACYHNLDSSTGMKHEMGVREGRDWGQLAVWPSRCAHCVYADAHLAITLTLTCACVPGPGCRGHDRDIIAFSAQ